MKKMCKYPEKDPNKTHKPGKHDTGFCCAGQR